MGRNEVANIDKDQSIDTLILMKLVNCDRGKLERSVLSVVVDPKASSEQMDEAIAKLLPRGRLTAVKDDSPTTGNPSAHEPRSLHPPGADKN